MFVNDLFKLIENSNEEYYAVFNQRGKPMIMRKPAGKTAQAYAEEKNLTIKGGPFNSHKETESFWIRSVLPSKKEQGIEEAGPFSYGAKKPRKGSVADLAAQKRKEQEKDKQPVEPRDRMIGVARVKKDVAEGSDNITAVFSGYGNYMSGRGANVFKHYGITVLDKQYFEDEDIAEYTVSGSKEALDQARAYLERSDQFGGMIIKQGVAEGFDDSSPHDSYVLSTRNVIDTNGKSNLKDRTASLSTDRKGNQRVRAVVGDEIKINTDIPTGVTAKMVPQQGDADIDEGSVQDKLHRRHQEIRKKRGAPDPEYYQELKKTYDMPDDERWARTAELKKKYNVSEARKSEVNFDIEDIKKLERIRDLPTLKAQALALISKPSERPMKPEKVAWFDAALDRMDSPLKIIKLMYDLLLSGEGHQVIGSKRSMNPNSYRDRFGESTITNEDVERYVEELERAGYEILEEKTRLDPSCWKGYRKAGTKMKGGVRVNNCVPVKKKVDEYGAANGPPNLNKSDIKRMMPPEPVAEQIPTITDTGPREQPHPAAQTLDLVRGLKRLAGIDKYDVENAVNQEITNVVRSPQDASSKNVSIINRLFGPRQ